MRKRIMTATTAAGIVGATALIPANASTTYVAPSNDSPTTGLTQLVDTTTSHTPQVVTLPAPTPVPAAYTEPTPTYSYQSTGITEISTPVVSNANVQLILDRHNAYRASLGLPALQYDAGLSNVAQNWAYQMGSMQSMVHNPSITAEAPAGWSAVGENIAYNSWGGTQGANMLVDQWINSPVHHAQLTSANFNTIGIGVVEMNGYTWGVVNFGTY